MDQIQQLQWALQPLALPAPVQISLFPGFVVVADELALDFDHWHQAALGHLSPSESQRVALNDINVALNEMSVADCWTNDALQSHPKWKHVRQLAKAALAAFGWQEGVPPTGRSTYVPAGPSPT